MRRIIHRYKPKKKVTLYDVKKHAFCNGILYIDPLVEANHPLYYKKHTKFFPILKRFALVALILAFIGIFITALPVIIAQASLSMGHSTQKTLVGEVSKEQLEAEKQAKANYQLFVLTIP